MALMAGVFLVTLSVSAAFGAAPAATRDATRGQTIAAFVHELIFGTDETDEPNEEPTEDLDEDSTDETDPLDDESDETDEVDETDEEADAHGACVSEVARDAEAIGGPNENHGGAVSEAARETCRETDEDADDPDATLDEEDADEDSHGACVSEVARDKSAVGGKNGNH
jgi:hypothetical protein